MPHRLTDRPPGFLALSFASADDDLVAGSVRITGDPRQLSRFQFVISNERDQFFFRFGL
jgi:hypothetical protein